MSDPIALKGKNGLVKDYVRYYRIIKGINGAICTDHQGNGTQYH